MVRSFQPADSLINRPQMRCRLRTTLAELTVDEAERRLEPSYRWVLSVPWEEDGGRWEASDFQRSSGAGFESLAIRRRYNECPGG